MQELLQVHAKTNLIHDLCGRCLRNQLIAQNTVQFYFY
jgi:hypothetical protein